MRSVLAAVMCVLAGRAAADSATASSRVIEGDSGAAVYQHVCQGCHMPGGRGAVGAGTFPALAGNAKLADAGYPIYMVLNGNGGMPWFNGALSDAQIADVVNYVRTHFGNDYKDRVTAVQVAALRGPAPTLEK